MQSCINETNTYVMAQNKYNANTNPEKANHPDFNDHTHCKGQNGQGQCLNKKKPSKIKRHSNDWCSHVLPQDAPTFC